MPRMLSSLQLARLVQIYLAEPGASLDEKAALVGIRRNALLRATHGTISRTVRLRLLAYFAAVRPQLAPAHQARARAGKSCGNAGLDELPPRPGVARPAVVP